MKQRRLHLAVLALAVLFFVAVHVLAAYHAWESPWSFTIVAIAMVVLLKVALVRWLHSRWTKRLPYVRFAQHLDAAPSVKSGGRVDPVKTAEANRQATACPSEAARAR